jgi:hypothetical protein
MYAKLMQCVNVRHQLYVPICTIGGDSLHPSRQGGHAGHANAGLPRNAKLQSALCGCSGELPPEQA